MSGENMNEFTFANWWKLPNGTFNGTWSDFGIYYTDSVWQIELPAPAVVSRTVGVRAVVQSQNITGQNIAVTRSDESLPRATP